METFFPIKTFFPNLTLLLNSVSLIFNTVSSKLSFIALIKAIMSKSFYNNKGPLKILDILKTLNLKDNSFTEDIKVFDVKDLFSAKSSDISFLHSKKYKDIAKKTKASFCITTNNLKNELPKNCKPLIVDNVLVSMLR